MATNIGDAIEMSNETCKTMLRDLIAREQLDSYTMDLTKATAAGDNYMGTICRVRVQGRKQGRDVNKSYVVKLAPDFDRARMLIDVLYEREILFYTEIAPKIERYQNEARIPDGERLKFATYHGGDRAYMREFFIMDDLMVEGFVLHDRKRSLEMEHMRLLMTSMAALHAFSFALRRREPLEFERIVKRRLRNGEETPDVSLMKPAFDMACRNALNVVADDEILRRKVETYNERAFDTILESIDYGATLDPYTVLCHGDFWVNNLMFKIEVSK